MQLVQVCSGRMEVISESWWPCWCSLLAGKSCQALSPPGALCLLLRTQWRKWTQNLTSTNKLLSVILVCVNVRTGCAGFGMVSYPGFALEGVSIVELIKKVRGLLELHTSFSDWSGWRCCCCQTKKQNISKISFCCRNCMCSIYPFIMCLFCEIKYKKWPSTAACGQQKVHLLVSWSSEWQRLVLPGSVWRAVVEVLVWGSMFWEQPISLQL